MNTKDNDLVETPDDREEQMGDTPGINNETKENAFPDKSKKLNVLHQDGSLADLPDGEADGSGALDGTVGLGT